MIAFNANRIYYLCVDLEREDKFLCACLTPPLWVSTSRSSFEWKTIFSSCNFTRKSLNYSTFRRKKVAGKLSRYSRIKPSRCLLEQWTEGLCGHTTHSNTHSHAHTHSFFSTHFPRSISTVLDPHNGWYSSSVLSQRKWKQSNDETSSQLLSLFDISSGKFNLNIIIRKDIQKCPGGWRKVNKSGKRNWSSLLGLEVNRAKSIPRLIWTILPAAPLRNNNFLGAAISLGPSVLPPFRRCCWLNEISWMIAFLILWSDYGWINDGKRRHSGREY